MIKRLLVRAIFLALAFAVFTHPGASVLAQPPMGPPGSGSDTGELPWQVAVTFTANWVLAAVAVAILSRPSKRTDKPKKSMFDDEDK
jgi:hypothetical protein